MSSKLGNYGDWEGNRDHHPPNCTCFGCNEERQRLQISREEADRVAEYDRRVAQSQGQQQTQPVRRPPPTPPRKPSEPKPSKSRSENDQGGFFTIVFCGLAVLAMLTAAIGGTLYLYNPDIFASLPSDETAPPTRTDDVEQTPEPVSVVGLPYPGGIPLDVGEIEHEIAVFTNRLREGKGLPPLVSDPRIADIARTHSENMASQDEFAHEVDGKNATGRALAAGYNCRANLGDGRSAYGLGENIAKGGRVQEWVGRGGDWTPTKYDKDGKTMAWRLVWDWMGSPGHRENILREQYHRIGVDVHIALVEKHGYVQEIMWATQNFPSCQ